MELLEKYIEELKLELSIDEMNVSEVQRRLPARRHYWTARLIRHKHDLININKEKHQREREIAEKLREKSVTRLSIPESLKMAKNSSEMMELTNKCKELELIIEFLEKTEKNLTSMAWDIKNIVELMKLEML